MPPSILKKTKSPSASTPAPPGARSREDHNRETATYHAQLLQQRKDVEALVLASIEALLDVPSSLDADPAHPIQSDAALVKRSLRPFQASDYDALIEERNINGQCGYVLCPRNNRKQDTKARYRILHGKGKDSDALNFVLTQSLEKWCSDDCGKRALYVKVQLDEEPAWTRADSSSGDTELLEDKSSSNKETILVKGMTNFDMGLAENRIIERMRALAIERGDGDAFSRQRGLGEVDVREIIGANTKLSFPESPISGSIGQHDSIEGYTPRSLEKTMKGAECEEEEDMLPTI